MDITYGKGECFINYNVEEISTIVIKYRGSATFRHEFRTISSFLGGDRILLSKASKKNLFIEGNNQIHIGFLESVNDLSKLFDYIGEFKILSAKVNKKNIPIKVTNVDYCELIDSKFDNMGKPEQYKGTYIHGRIPKRKRKMTTKKLSTRTATGRSRGGGGY